MKKYLALMFLFTAILTLDSCKDDDDDGLCKPEVGSGNYYRIQAFGEVDVVPAQRQVRMLTRVSDEENVGVDNLSITNFVLKENCEDKVSDSESKTQIDRQSIPVNVKTVLLLDISASMEGQVDKMKTAVDALIDEIKETQQLAIYTFDSKVTLIQGFTSDQTILKSKVAAIPETGLDASTNLYQAMIDGAGSWEDNLTVNSIEFGNMIVFTDGKHNADPSLTVDKVKAITKDKSVFIAALKSDNLDEVSLKDIAGSEKNYALATDINALKGVFSDIQVKVDREANSIYFLTYTSPIAVSGNQDLLLYLKDNSNGGDDSYVRKNFSTEGF